MTTFYDSADAWNIPAHADALLYGDGLYAATAEQAARLGAVRWITVYGNTDCGAADFEGGNPVFGGAALRNWATGRRDRGWRARVYCDRSNLPRAHTLVGDLPNVVWWVATLDGNPYWTARSLSENIYAQTRLEVGPALIWAVQWWGGMSAPYDKSQLLGRW